MRVVADLPNRLVLPCLNKLLIMSKCISQIYIMVQDRLATVLRSRTDCPQKFQGIKMLVQVSSDPVLKTEVSNNKAQQQGCNTNVALMEFTLKEEAFTLASMVRLQQSLSQVLVEYLLSSRCPNKYSLN